MTIVGTCVFKGCNQLIVAYVPQHLQLNPNVFASVSAGFLRYTDIDLYNAIPIVRLTRQPYFRFSNREVGLELFPGAREVLRTLYFVQNRIDGNSPISFPMEILLYILEFLKWSEMHYRLR